ncbi:MAG TPA: polysaccharide biosynthesis C-terminal domain-containing protein [Steroidobacteraceae bacterium]|nr:polysaccharide biosynthesis C-terminal domain-containing protein [Steroidobacteraceae bacterium]
MRERRLGQIVHMFGTGVVDQVLLSGANFLVGLAMIRFTSDVDYGQFILVQSAVLLLTSAQSAWLAPLCAIIPSKPPAVRQAIVGAVEASQTRFLHKLVLAAALVPVIGYLIGAWSVIVAIVSEGAILASWTALQREYLRSVLVIYGRPQQMLRADVVYTAVLLPVIAFAVFGSRFHSIWAVAALIVAGWAGGRAAYRSFAADPGWVGGDATPYWREMRPLAVWSATGAVTYWLLAQSYNYVLATRLDFTAVINVNAARLVMVPVIVFTMGINNLLLPVAANWLAEAGLHRLMRRLAWLTLGIVVLDAIYFVLAWIFRDWLISDLLHKTIADRDRLLILWGCVALIFLFREVLQAALFALKRVKSMAWLIACSAVVSVLTTWFGIRWWGAVAALYGQVAGECVNLAGLSLLLWRQAKRVQSDPPGESQLPV